MLLIERGDIADSWVSRIPLFSSHFSSDGSRSKVWKSVPQPSLGGREIDLVGGASLGGASKINAMLYTRGLPAEYDFWNANGAKGWSYDQLLPFFTRSERHLGKGQSVTTAPEVMEKKSYSMDWHNTEGVYLPRVCKPFSWNEQENGKIDPMQHRSGATQTSKSRNPTFETLLMIKQSHTSCFVPRPAIHR